MVNENLRAVLGDATTIPTRFVGTGTYRIGGEIALTHEMKRLLSSGGGPERSHQSGLVPGGAALPQIHISVSASEVFCTQYILALDLVTTCTADFDGDGYWAGRDVDLFVQAFEAGSGRRYPMPMGLSTQ